MIDIKTYRIIHLFCILHFIYRVRVCVLGWGVCVHHGAQAEVKGLL